MATTTDGKLFAWGSTARGRLGLDPAHLSRLEDTNEVATPQLVDSLAGCFVSSVASSADHSFAITADGGLYAWGGAMWGALGLGDLCQLPTTPSPLEEPYQPTPMRVDALHSTRVRKVACNAHHALALSSEGTLWAWGLAGYGRLGLTEELMQRHGTLDEYQDRYLASPQQLQPAAGSEAPWADMAAALAHNLAVTSDGELYVWGSGNHGRLGLEDVESLAFNPEWGRYAATPLRHPMLDCEIQAVACNHRQSFAVRCCGEGLAKDMTRMLEDAKFADVIFRFGDGHEARGHRALLAARSAYFAKMFQGPMLEAQGARAEMTVEGDRQGFEDMLQWLYTETIPPRCLASPASLIALLDLADRYRIAQLAVAASRAIRRCLTNENVLDVLEAADRLNAPDLRRSSLDFVLHHFDAVKEASQCFDGLDATLMREVMQGLGAAVAGASSFAP